MSVSYGENSTQFMGLYVCIMEELQFWYDTVEINRKEEHQRYERNS